MSATAEKLVWIDCEMTGLDVQADDLIEIAVIVTDYDLNILDDGIDLVIAPSQASLDQMNDFVRNMHEGSGLLQELSDGLTLQAAEARVLEYLERHLPGEQQAAVAGNSIATDRAFLNEYMPGLATKLHYRSVDVSSIKELARRWFPRSYFKSPEKSGGHRALADIRESIQELAYYRKAVFRDGAGLDSDSLKLVAEETVKRYQGQV